MRQFIWDGDCSGVETFDNLAAVIESPLEAGVFAGRASRLLVLADCVHPHREAIQHWHGPASLLRADLDPVMDGTGLRLWICTLAKRPSASDKPLR